MGCAGSKAEPESRYTASAAARPASREFGGPHSEMASAVAAGRVPGEVLSCGEDRSVALTDWMDGKVLQRWEGHEKGVNCVLHAPLLDGAFFLGTCCRLQPCGGGGCNPMRKSEAATPRVSCVIEQARISSPTCVARTRLRSSAATTPASLPVGWRGTLGRRAGLTTAGRCCSASSATRGACTARPCPALPGPA